MRTFQRQCPANGTFQTLSSQPRIPHHKHLRKLYLRQRIVNARASQPVQRQIDRSGKNVATLKASWSQDYEIRNPKVTSPTVGQYLKEASIHLQHYKLPLGAELSVVDLKKELWELQLPKMQFLSIFIR
jgi:hypothetical protein